MIKVLTAALLGTVAGIAVMVIAIVLAGTHTQNSSSIGLGNLSTPTASAPGSSTSTSTSTSTTPSTSTGGGQGNAANGKTVFNSAGCSGCHTFTAAGSSGTVGPNLDSLAADAQKAGQALPLFVKTSIVDPSAYIAPGYQNGIMPATFATQLSASDIADLVAFITQNQK